MEDSVEIEVHRRMDSEESDGDEVEEEGNPDQDSFEIDSEGEEDLEKRQLSYPQLPVYNSPMPSPAKERLGLLTPTEELSEGEQSVVYTPRVLDTRGESGNSLKDIRRVSFIPPVQSDHRLSPEIEIEEDDVEPDEIEDLILLQSRQELVLNWQEKHLHHLSSDEFRDILHSSEMDSSSIMKSLRSIPPSNFATVVQEMTNSLATLRSQLSTLNTISLFGDRLRELQPYEYNLDLLPLIKKLCTLIGESRSPESSVTLSKLIQGAGPTLITEDLLYIINANNMKRKPAAIDGLTLGLLTFPRDDFDIEKVAEGVSGCLWNPKRRIRQAALESLAVVAHVLGPGIAMPFLRELIEQKRSKTINITWTLSMSNVTLVEGQGHPFKLHKGKKPASSLTSASGAVSAVSARVSRRLLPSSSPIGLIDYGLVLPSKQLSKVYLEQIETLGGLDPILSKGEYGPDVLWILHGAGNGDRSRSNSDRSSSDSQGRKKSCKTITAFRAEVVDQQEDFLRQKLRDNLVYEEEERMKEKLAEIKLQQLERNYERSLHNFGPVDDFHLNEDYVKAKTTFRDRDSGVSSLKSVRVTSPTESSSSKSPIPDADVPVFPNVASTPPSISSQSDELEGSSMFIQRPVMPRSSRTSLTSISSQTGRVQHSPPSFPPNAIPNIPTSNSASTVEHSDWLKKSCATKIPPRKAKSTSRETGSRLAPSVSSTQLSASRSSDSPKNTLSQGLTQLSSTDWETTVDGFVLLTRLLRQNPEQIRSDLPTVNRAALLHLSNLRTQVTRAACLFFEDLFVNLGKSMEQDSEKIAEKLLDKAADTNKFIREGSMAALEAMVKHLAPAKTIIPLENYGAKHRNSVVRSTTAHVTRVLVQQMGPERVLHQNPQKLLPMLVKFLQEGSLDTRTQAKMALSCLVVHGSFESSMKRYIPSSTLKNVEKSISSIKNDLIRKG